MTTAMDAVAVAAAGVTRLYRTNSVPDKPTYPYGSFVAHLGRGDTFLLSAQEGLRWGRVVVQTFGKTADSAVAMAEDVRAALVGTRLTITGVTCAPLQAELDPSATRDPDDFGVVGVTSTYTFTASEDT